MCPLNLIDIIKHERLLRLPRQLRGRRAGELRAPLRTTPMTQVEAVPLALSDKDIIAELKRIDTATFQNYEEIATHENFDFLYHLLK